MSSALAKLLSLSPEPEAQTPAVVDFAEESALTKPVAEDPWQALDAKSREVATERVEFVRLVLEMVQNGGYTRKQAAGIVAMRQDVFPVLSTKGKGGTSALTYDNFRRWAGMLKDRRGKVCLDNRMAVVDHYTKGVRARKGDQRFWDLFCAAYLNQNKLPITDAYENAKVVYLGQQKGPFLNNAIPTLDQVRYFVKNRIPFPMLIQGRFGNEAYQNSVEGYIHRNWDGVQPNDMWFGDHHVFDVAIRMPDGKGGYESVRPWFTAWMDAKSHYFIGVCIRTCAPNSLAIEESLLSGIVNAGMVPPKVLYIDNGKDYVSQGLVQPIVVDGVEHSICRELGAQHVEGLEKGQGTKVIRAIPYNAKAKVIERRFKNFAEGFSRLFAAWLGNCPANRPERAVALWGQPGELMNLHQFTTCFELYLERYHNKPAKDSKILQGMSPREAWEARPVRPAMTEAQLHFAMLKPVAVRKVGRGAMVKWDGMWWQNDALYNYMGEQVLVKVDRLGRGNVWVFRLDGTLIGECAQPQQVAALAQSEDERRMISTQMAKNRAQRKVTRTGIKELTGGSKMVFAERLVSGDDEAVEVIAPSPRTKGLPAGGVSQQDMDDIRMLEQDVLMAAKDDVFDLDVDASDLEYLNNEEVCDEEW